MSAQQDNEQVNPSQSNTSILVIEDDAGVGDFLVAALEQETPYMVTRVTDGFQAFSAIKQTRFHLIILDYSLPRMNGLEFFDILSIAQGSHMPPVLMISAYLPKAELASRQLDTMHKPLDLEEFLAKVEKLLKVETIEDA